MMKYTKPAIEVVIMYVEQPFLIDSATEKRSSYTTKEMAPGEEFD